MKKLSKNAERVCKKRYYLPGEDSEKMWRRIANGVSQAELLYETKETKETKEIKGKNEEDKGNTELLEERRKEVEDKFFDTLSSLKFIPNSPTIHAAGTKGGMLSACFLIELKDSLEGIYSSLAAAARVQRMGGGTGFNFSKLRPRKSPVGDRPEAAGGPVAFMEIFDKSSEIVTQTGLRSGASIAVLSIDHPEILRFIEAKSDHSNLNNFNISVAITDKFMTALRNESTYRLVDPRFPKKDVGVLSAKEVWDALTQAAHNSGDPGVIFIDTINRDNTVPKQGKISGVNPCGEIPLFDWESCNLGSIDISKFVIKTDSVETDNAEVESDDDINLEYLFDLHSLRDAIITSVRFLDNIIDISNHPLPEIEKATVGNRKIGLGIMGFADALILLQIPYNSEVALEIAEELMEYINEEAKASSERLAAERGSFKNFSKSIYKTPIRNATRTTIAPTGTVSIIADTSPGIEPLFSVVFKNIMVNPTDNSTVKFTQVHPIFEKILKERKIYTKSLIDKIEKHGSLQHLDEIPEDLKKIFLTAHDISPEDHIKMQAAFQRHTDNSISKTINFSNEATVQDVSNSYLQSYKSGCKGITIYRDGSRDIQALTRGSAKKDIKDTIKDTKRSRKLKGETYSLKTGCGKIYITVNKDENGIPIECFANIGKAGGCPASQTEAIGRLTSMAFRNKVSSREVAKQLLGISCHKPYGFGPDRVLSCADAIGKVILDNYNNSNGDVKDIKIEIINNSESCPECGGPTEFSSGCLVCLSCGYSSCV